MNAEEERIVDVLFDRGSTGWHLLPGANTVEWLQAWRVKLDDVDRFYVDAETIGG